MSSIEGNSLINPVNSADWADRAPVVVISCGCHRAGDTWLRLAERVLQSWQMTLRMALLVLLVSGMAVLSVTLGFVR